MKISEARHALLAPQVRRRNCATPRNVPGRFDPSILLRGRASLKFIPPEKNKLPVKTFIALSAIGSIFIGYGIWNIAGLGWLFIWLGLNCFGPIFCKLFLGGNKNL
jgi:hypothetical protein